MFLCTLAVVFWFFSGCTTSYAPTTSAATRDIKIEAGDEIRVVTTRRERLSFHVTEVRADRLVGVTVKPNPKETRPAGETVEVPFDELAVVDVRRFDARKAGLATAAVVLTVSALSVVLGAVPVMPAETYQ
jgi:hypothetical protein